MPAKLDIAKHRQLDECVRHLLKAAALRRSRALLVIFNASDQLLKEFSARYNCTHVPSTSIKDRADCISSLLGTERRLASIQLAYLPDLGLLAALAGTVQNTGLLVLGISSTASSCPGQSGKLSNITTPSRSIARLTRLAYEAATQCGDTVRCISLTQDRLPQSAQWENATQPATQAGPLQVLPDNGVDRNNPQAIAEQNRLFSQAIAHWNNNRGSCIVIRGRRGRGKSHLMARLALHLQNTALHFLITARHRNALHAFYKICNDVTDCYVSAESAAHGHAQILFIEEASDFSIARLKTYLHHYEHVVLCTTTEGYESAGRALGIQILDSWNDGNKPLLELTPEHPWRWRRDDPLERFVDRLCLRENKTDVSVAEQGTESTSRVEVISDKRCHVNRIDRQELTHDDALLANVHNLLFCAHYQSTTKDLTHLLDAPTLELWALDVDGQLVAVLWFDREGEIPVSLHEAIVGKQRRLPNQLLPQLLAQCANDGRAVGKRYARVVRVAVSPSLRRRGLASRLLRAVTAYLTTSGEGSRIDALGACFSYDSISYKFWMHHGFKEFHRGYRANPRTGERSVACMQTIDTTCGIVLETAQQIHRDNVASRATGKKETKRCGRLTKQDLTLLARFSANQRSAHDCAAALQKLLAYTPFEAPSDSQHGKKRYEAALRKHVQACLKQ